MKYTKLSTMILATALAGMTVAAHAGSASPVQGFTDIFNVAGGNMISHNVLSGQLSITDNSANTFTVSEPTGVLQGGEFQVTAGIDAAHSCTITVQDVDFNYPTFVSKTCTSRAYDISLDNIGSNSGTITFHNKS